MNMNEDKNYKYENSFCGFCNKHITYKIWSRHLRTLKHLRKDSARIITPKTKKKTRNIYQPHKST